MTHSHNELRFELQLLIPGDEPGVPTTLLTAIVNSLGLTVEYELLGAVVAALTDWAASTSTGWKAMTQSSWDFNMGDLVLEMPSTPQLRRFLRKQGILELSTVSMAAKEASLWTHDTRLMDIDQLRQAPPPPQRRKAKKGKTHE